MTGREATEAAGSQRDAIEGAQAAGCYESALRHLLAGRHLDAIKSCEQVLALDAGHADTLHLLGLISLQGGQFDAALEWVSRAIRLTAKPEYLSTVGIVLRNQGRHEDALKAFDKAVQLRPGDAGSWRHLGDALVDLGRFDDALLSYQHAMQLDPVDWEAANKCAYLFHRLQRFDEALAGFALCDRLRPDELQTLHMRMDCFCRLKRFDDALIVGRRAMTLDPNDADTCNNVGAVLQSLGRDDQALEHFDRAIGLRPGFVDAQRNRASSLTKLRRLPEALSVYEELLATDPGDAVAGVGKAHLHLLIGDFAAGWIGREHRWNGASGNYPKLSRPMWLGGGDIAGKTLLVGADEGFGDTIQFVRYVPMVAAKGACVVLVVQDQLQPLLSRVEGVSRCIPFSASASLPSFDLHVPMTSLPLAFGTTLETVPAGVPYLPLPAEDRRQAWEQRLGPNEKLRIGLVWSGNPRHTNDVNRSVPLRLLARLLDLPATFVSLQKDPRPADKSVLAQRTDIVDWTDHLADFGETAALVSCLDLVITVDSSVAHLVGALGKPVWIMLPQVPDFRWLLDREDSPWYPSVKLFRQDETRDYGSVLDRMRAALVDVIAGRAVGPSAANGGKVTIGHRPAC